MSRINQSVFARHCLADLFNCTVSHSFKTSYSKAFNYTRTVEIRYNRYHFFNVRFRLLFLLTQKSTVYQVNLDGSGLKQLNLPGADSDVIAVNRKEKRICIASQSKRHDITAIDMAYVHMRLNVNQNHSSGYYILKIN